MRAGRLRHRVEILRRTIAPDDWGQEAESWPVETTVWGELTPLLTGTREAFAAAGNQVVAQVSWQVRMRH